MAEHIKTWSRTEIWRDGPKRSLPGPMYGAKEDPRLAACSVSCAPDVHPSTIGNSHRHVLPCLMDLFGELDHGARWITPQELASDAFCVEGFRIHFTSERPPHFRPVVKPSKVKTWWRRHGRKGVRTGLVKNRKKLEPLEAACNR